MPKAEPESEDYRLPFGSVFAGAPGQPLNRATNLLAAPAFSHAANHSVRALALKRAQQTHGNHAAQRMVARLQRKSSTTRAIQRNCACGGTCSECSAAPIQVPSGVPFILPKSNGVIQAQAAGASGAAGIYREDRALSLERSQGQSLDDRTRRFMESRFGRDFKDIRVHADGEADASARAINADAFTTGRDIYFAAGKYAPSTQQGQHLLAHELTHTVQQSEGGMPTQVAEKTRDGLIIGSANDPMEHEADRVADAVTSPAAPPVGALSADRAPAARRGIGDWASSAWEATGGRVTSYVGEVIEDTAEWFMEKIEYYVPGLLTLLRGDVVELLKEKVGSGVDSFFGGLISRVQKEGLVGALAGVVSELTGKVSAGAGQLTASACAVFGKVAQAVFDFAKMIGGTAFEALKQGAAAIGGFFSDLWNKFGGPAWKVIKEVAGSAWDWIESKAKWIWEKTAPVRETLARAWRWLKQKFSLAWDSGMGVLDWLKEKAAAAWAKLKEFIQPIMGPLKVVGGILLALSPLGPILLIWKAAPVVWDALKWVWENWNKANIIVEARKILEEKILPAILSGVQKVGGLLTAAAAWISEKTDALKTAFGNLADALGVSSFLRLAQRAIQFVGEKVTQLAAWVKNNFVRLVDAAKTVLQKIWSYVQPVLVILVKLSIVAANPWLWPVFLSAVAWKILPDCFKPPIIDFVLDLMIAALRAIPNFKSFGETWAQVKQSMLKTLIDVRKGSPAQKIEISNRIAEMIAGGSLEGYGNLIAAARQVPEHFIGQVEEELIGMNLNEPLPFERQALPEGQTAQAAAAAAAVEAGTISPGDTALLTRSTIGSNELGVTHVADLQLSPEVLEAAGLQADGEVTFGSSGDPANTIAGVQEELAGGSEANGGRGVDEATSTAAAPQTANGLGPDQPPVREIQETVAGAEEPAPVAPLSTDEQLALLMNQPLPQTCTTEKPAEGPAQQNDVPESMKIGPLTASQRGHYMWEQMKKGMRHWYECHKTAIWVSIIAALVVIIIAAILTGGAILEALPPILEIIGSIMIGVAMVRVAGYIAQYVVKAFTGDISGGAKSLARGLAVGAIELIFAILFNLGAVIKSIKSGLKSGLQAVQRTAARVAPTVVKGARQLAQTSARMGRRLAAGLRSFGGAFIRNGKIIFRGLEQGFWRGVRSLDDLASRLLQRIRARFFRLIRRGERVSLQACFNGCVLFANGDVIEGVSLTGGRPEIADLIEGVGRRQAGILISRLDTEISSAAQAIKSMSRAERQELYRDLIALLKTGRQADVDAARALILGTSATGANAKELRKALIAAGEAISDDAHHIVPSTHRLADEARQILQKAGININDARNGAFLSEARHAGLHTTEYMEKITELLRSVPTSQVPAQLAMIKAVLKKGGLKALLAL